MAASARANEEDSIAALRRLEVLDTAPEEAFDALVEVASAVCGKPISLISLIDTDRQWFKANVGLPGVQQTPRDAAFCAHAVLGEGIFEVEDATRDERFADNTLVVGQPDIRFYAGAPLTLGSGERVGTLCVIDRSPGKLTEPQRRVLSRLAIVAVKVLEGRVATMQAEQAMRVAAASQKDLRLVVDNAPAMMAYWNADLTCRFANQAYRDWLGLNPQEMIGKHILDVLGPALFELNESRIAAALAGQRQSFERLIPGPLGVRHGLTDYVPDVVDGKVIGLLVQVTDVTALKAAEQALRLEMDDSARVQRLLQDSMLELDRAQRLGAIGSWSWDPANDQVQWSAELFRITGRDPAAGAPSLAEQAHIYTPESFERMRDAAIRSLERGDSYQFDMEYVRPDGQHGWVEARGEPVRDDNGAVAGLRGTVQDITERRRIQDELAQQHDLMQVTLQSIGDAVITTDAAGAVVWLNPVAERMTGWLADSARGRPLTQVFHIVNEETRAVTENPVATCLAQGKIVGLANHTLLISRDGAEYGIEDSAAPIRNAAGQVLGVVLVFHDVSEQRRISGEMTYRATHDLLTGLVNRAEFETRLLRVLRKAHEDGTEHALLYIDLDQFKLVNDACGHAVGDQLLQQVGRLLGEAVRARDTLARLGGDEFAIILEHCTADQALQVAQKICDRMDDYRFTHDDRRFRIGASIGLVPVDKRWSGTAAIQQAADTSCYAAKEAGRNRVHAWFDTDLAMRARHSEMKWTTRIEQALDNDGFALFAQRIQALRGGEQGLHAEVLLRMKNDDGTYVPPGVFLPAAERFHLVSRVDRWVLRQVLEWMGALPSLDAISMLSVNLSGQSVGDRAFHNWAKETLGEASAAVRSRLCLEITETAAVTNAADAAIFIEAVRAEGVKVALDDFGAGASSFGYLKTLPVDFLKIDGQFIRDLNVDPLDAAAVRCFVEVAKVVGMQTVAEFVEQPAVLDSLREMGVDYAQGYLIHRPEPIGRLLETTPPQMA